MENLKLAIALLFALAFGWLGYMIGLEEAQAAERPAFVDLLERELAPHVFRLDRKGNTLYVRYRVTDYVVTVREQ